MWDSPNGLYPLKPLPVTFQDPNEGECGIAMSILHTLPRV